MAIQRLNPPGLHALNGVSLAVRAGDLVFLAGQVATDKSGRVTGTDADTQLRQVFANIEAVCTSMGGSLSSLVKTTTYLTRQEYFDNFLKIRSEMYGEEAPANTTLVLPSLARPEWLVEIEAVAYIPPSLQ